MTEPIPRFRTLTYEEQHSYEARHIRPSLVKCDDGNLVAYSDYAALAAEKERLQSAVRHYVEQEALRKVGETMHNQRIESGAYNRDKNETIKRLAAENERLRKAGDAMADEWRCCQMDDGNKLLVDWNAAKEERDAK